jgi:hypothetical protein
MLQHLIKPAIAEWVTMSHYMKSMTDGHVIIEDA